MNTIADQWATFEKMVITDPDITDDHRQEMRLAFYAGAHAVVSMQADLADSRASGAAIVAIIDVWVGEITDVMQPTNRG